MAHTTCVIIVCDVCGSRLPTSQVHNVRKARGEARAAGWTCVRRKGDLCGRCARALTTEPTSTS